MKKLTAILLLVISCIAYAAYHFICAYEIQYAKEQSALKMLRQIPDNQLTKIEDDKSLKWSSDDELWYNNQIFDVVKQVSQNGKKYILCIADADEADALKKMADLVQSGSDPASNGKDGIKIKNSLQDIFCNQFYQENETLTSLQDINYFNDYCSSLSELSRKILIPPPKFNL